MSYAAKLIDMAKDAQGFSNTELAIAMGVKQPTIAGWRAGRGSPMSEDRVIELCRLAGIKDYAPWLIGVHAEHLRNREARSSLEKLARQLGAAAALAVVALLPQGNAHASARANMNDSPNYALCEVAGSPRAVGASSPTPRLSKVFTAENFGHSPQKYCSTDEPLSTQWPTAGEVLGHP